ncbi:MAG: 50S ribosomal protein L29 [Gammaproteobacteria bacterium]|nr:50S ribosomal protein L29 [Gammaproteobacteria bacterium]
MKIQELRKQSFLELKNKAKELYRQQFQFRIKAGDGEEVRTHLHREMRRDLARIKTLERELHMKANKGGQA